MSTTPEPTSAVPGRLVLIRHGQSNANVARKLDTRPPGQSLTDDGRDQAVAFGRTHSGRPPAALLASIAVRAQQTADLIGGVVARPVETVEGIHEVQAGDLEDRNDADAHRLFAGTYSEWFTGRPDRAIPGGESGTDVLTRYLPEVDLIRERLADGDVWVVSHGAAIRWVAATLAGVDGRFATTRHLDNTETAELILGPDGRWTCVRWGREIPPFPIPSADEPSLDSDISDISSNPMG